MVIQIFITAHPKPNWLLGVIHLAGSILANLGLMNGVSELQWSFILADVINGYLVQGLSPALVHLAMTGMINKKAKD